MLASHYPLSLPLQTPALLRQYILDGGSLQRDSLSARTRTRTTEDTRAPSDLKLVLRREKD